MKLEQGIDTLFERETEKRGDSLKDFSDRLHINYDAVHRAALRMIVVFVFVWVVSFAVGKGSITEGSVASFKLARLDILLAVTPAALGGLSYAHTAYQAMGLAIWCALRRCYKYSLPTAYLLGLEQLIAPPTLFTIERFFGPHRGESIPTPLEKSVVKLAHIAFKLTYAGLITVIPALAILHTAYLGWSKGLPLPLQTLSGLIGIALWFRGLVLVVREPLLFDIQEAANTAPAADG